MYDATGFFNVSGYYFLILKFPVVPADAKEWGYIKNFLISARRMYPLTFKKTWRPMHLHIHCTHIRFCIMRFLFCAVTTDTHAQCLDAACVIIQQKSTKRRSDTNKTLLLNGTVVRNPLRSGHHHHLRVGHGSSFADPLQSNLIYGWIQ